MGIADLDRAPPTARASLHSSAPRPPRKHHKEAQKMALFIVRHSTSLQWAPTMCVPGPGDTEKLEHSLALRWSVYRRHDQGGRARWADAHPGRVTGDKPTAAAAPPTLKPSFPAGDSPSPTRTPSHMPSMATRSLRVLTSTGQWGWLSLRCQTLAAKASPGTGKLTMSEGFTRHPAQGCAAHGKQVVFPRQWRCN